MIKSCCYNYHINLIIFRGNTTMIMSLYHIGFTISFIINTMVEWILSLMSVINIVMTHPMVNQMRDKDVIIVTQLKIIGELLMKQLSSMESKWNNCQQAHSLYKYFAQSLFQIFSTKKLLGKITLTSLEI